MIRCKFRCVEVRDQGEHMPKLLLMETQYDPGVPEDQSFTKATPWGRMYAAVDNPAAVAQLTPGKCYYLDISPAGE